MYHEIKKRQVILEGRRPYPIEVSNFLEELDALDFIFSLLYLDGNLAQRDEVKAIINGEIRENLSVSDHTTIAKYRQGLHEMRFMADIHTDLTEKSLFRLYDAMYQPFTIGYRKNNLEVKALQYTPPHFFEIEEQIQVLFQWLYSEERERNPIINAAQLHNRIIEIWPFENDSPAIGRIAAQYYLVRHDFPIISWDVGVKQYYNAVNQYIQREDFRPIYDILESGIYNKQELLLQLTE